MLGEQISESRGKRIVRRVVSSDPLRVEVSFEDGGKILGIDFNNFGTYTSQIRPDGALYTEGQGALMTKDGEAVVWKGAGVGQIKEGGAVSYRGAVYFQTQSRNLARLNTTAGVYEFESTAAGETHTKIWEWR